MLAQNEAPDRRPPQNLEAEHGVLGSMLMDREAIGDVLLVLDDDDFYMPANAEIFRTLVGLYDRNEPVDLVLATDELNSGALAQVDRRDDHGRTSIPAAAMTALTAPTVYSP